MESLPVFILRVDHFLGHAAIYREVRSGYEVIAWVS
jgi:hypothetical protein